MNTITRKYAWKRDLPDIRDKVYSLAPPVTGLPPLVDLRPGCPAVYDQGSLGSCTGNAIAADCEFDMIKQGEKSFTPSRLGIYYLERRLEGSINRDTGAMIRDGIKVVAKYGIWPEAMQPYIVEQYRKAPTRTMLLEGQKHQALVYERLDGSLNQIKTRLASGYPFVFGFSVYPQFESQEMAKSGVVAMPSGLDAPLGGHAVLGVGYDDSKQCIIVRNSWGASWGLKGYFYMPYAYVSNPNLASDMWAITRME
ncbi:MAG: C1 family peptidase [Ignisphaera sp.]|nr:C1 family peptidase [Ignisphaera sp.]